MKEITYIYINPKNLCQIINETDLDLISKLDQDLSYKVLGAEFSPQYKYGRWDGIFRILTSDLIFPLGLLTRVEKFYSLFNKKITVVDKRLSLTPINSINILPRQQEMKCVPFYYQEEALKKCIQNRIGVLKLPTGSGKTNLCAMITAYFGKTTIIYVIGNDLLYQTHSFFEQVFQCKIGMIGDGVCNIEKINIASIWTIAQALGLKKDIILDEIDDEKLIEENKYDQVKKLLQDAKVHILDECHVASCQTIKLISKAIDPEHTYGLSASPWREDNSDILITGLLGERIIDISASELIDKGYLVRPTIKFITVPKFPEKIPKNYHTIYKTYIINNSVRNNLILQGTTKLVEQNYLPLILFNNIAHGEILYEMISKYIPCTLLSGKDSIEKRLQAKIDLENGIIKCIIASRVADIGYDLKILSALILAGGGKSSVRALQRIGRVIRNSPGKTKSAVIDFIDQEKYLIDHSKARRKIYASEPGFNLSWPENIKK